MAPPVIDQEKEVRQSHEQIKGYTITPRLDYRTVAAVNGPLVILENIKCPTFADVKILFFIIFSPFFIPIFFFFANIGNSHKSLFLFSCERKNNFPTFLFHLSNPLLFTHKTTYI
jgi:hypothetical protein